MTTPPTNAVSAVLLVDQRIQGYETIVSAVKSDVQCIVFDTNQVSEQCSQQSITSFQYILNKIAELGVSSFANIGIVQHNYNTPLHQFFGLNSAELSTVAGVETSDPSLQTWAGFAGFITTLKSTYGIQNVDLMACALYSNPDWKYIIDTLSVQTSVEVRASTDDTGAAELGGNWFLESHTGVNLKSVYFTDAIDEYDDILIIFNKFGYQQYPSKSFSPGIVKTWGTTGQGGDSSSVSASLVNVVAVYATTYAFAALKTDGTVVTWGDTNYGGNSSSVSASLVNVVNIAANNNAFAALKNDGTVVTWGDATSGGDSSSVSASLVNVVAIRAAPLGAFAALKSNGTVVVWGSSNFGGSTTTPINANASLVNVISIYSSNGAFAALKRDKTVVTWGGVSYGGSTSTAQRVSLVNVVAVYSNANNFAALKGDGTVVHWGTSSTNGSNVPYIPTNLNNVVSVYVGVNAGAVAALKSDGTVVTWGTGGSGSNSSSVSASLVNVVSVAIHNTAMAALKSDGTVVSWGLSTSGGDGSTVSASLVNVVAIYATSAAFAALKSDGTVVTWGDTSYGGNSSSVYGGDSTSASLVNIVAVYASYSSFTAIKSDGSAIFWGAGFYDLVSDSLTPQITKAYYTDNLYSTSTAVIKTTNISFDLSMSYYTDMDRFTILLKKEHRRRVNLTTLNNNVFTLSADNDLKIINPDIPTGTTLRIIVPDYVSSSYSITSTATIPSGAGSVIIACEEGERVTISGVTYVNYGTYVYKCETNNTYTKLTTTTIDGNEHYVYGGGDGVISSGIVLVLPTYVIYGSFTPPTKTFGDVSFSMVPFAPTSNNSGAYTYTSSVPGVATISSDGTDVSIVGAGSTTITFSQDICGNRPAGSTSGIFTVNQATTTYGTFTPPTKAQDAAPFSMVPYAPTSTNTGAYSYIVTSLITASAMSIKTYWTSISLSGTGGQYRSAVASLGYIWTSSDYGVTWTSRTAPGNLAWSSISLSATGQYQNAVVNGGYIWTSSDYGVTWTARTAPGSLNFTGISINGTGQYQSAVVSFGNIWTSSDYGVTWTARTGPGSLEWTSISVSLSGPFQVAIVRGTGSIWYSSNYGSTWTIKSSSLASMDWTSVATSSNGQYISATVSNGNIWTSSNSGTAWTARQMVSMLPGSWTSIAVSSTGQYQTATTWYGNIWTSSNYGVTWTERTEPRDVEWMKWVDVHISSTGQYQTAVISNGYIWYSIDYGVTWSQYASYYYTGNTGPVININPDGTVVTIVGAGSATITASQVATGNYLAGSKTGVITVTSTNSPPTYQSVSPVAKTYGTDVSFSMTDVMAGISNSSGAYTFTSSSAAISISGGVATILAYSASTISILASQDASGNYSAGSTTISLAVAAATPTFQSVSPVAKTYGTDVSFSLTDVMAGISNSSGAYTFTSSSGAISISGGVATILAYSASTISILASQDASGNYASSSTTISLAVAAATPTFQSVAQISKTYLTDVSFSLTDVMAGISNSSGAYTFSSASAAISISGGVATILAYSASTISILASQDASGNYASSSTTISLAVAAATPTFQSVAQISKTYLTDVSFSMTPIVSGMSNSDGAFIFTTSGSAVGVVDICGAVVTILAYTPPAVNIDVYQEASGNYTYKTGTISLLVARNSTSTVTNIVPVPTTPYYGSNNSEFVWPGGCRYVNNKLYVADVQNSRIQVFDSSLNFITKFSSPNGSVDVAVHPTSGRIHVVGSNKIDVFDSSFTLLFRVGGDDGEQPGSFSYPRAVAVDAAGNIYGSDGFRIQKFNSSGVYQSTIITSGTGDGQVHNAAGFDFDSNGNFWVCDDGGTNSTNNRIQKFDSNFNFLLKFGTFGTENGNFKSPRAVAFDSSNNVYIADMKNYRIQKFDNSGNYISQFGSYGTGNGQLDNQYGIAVDPAGNIFAVENYNHRVQKFNSSGVYQSKIGAVITASSSANGSFNTPGDVAMFPSNGNVYVVDTGNNRIQKFNSSLTWVWSVGSIGSGNSQFNTPRRIAIDASENIYVTDATNHCVKKFDSSGSFLLKFGTYGTGTGQFATPYGIAVDSAFNVLVTDNNSRVQKFGSDGTYITSYSIFNSKGISLDSAGNMYITSTNNNIYKYSSSGTLLMTMTNPAQFPGGGISVDQVSGNFAVVFESNQVCKIYNSTGTLLVSTTFNSTMNAPLGVYYNNTTLFYTDTYYHGVKKVALSEFAVAPTYTFTESKPQSITKTFGDATFSLSALLTGVSNSSGAYTFATSNSGAISIGGDGVTATVVAYNATAVTITATQAASGSSYSASSTTLTITVARKAPTYGTFTPPAKTFGDASFSVVSYAPTSESSGAYTYTSSAPGVATISSDGTVVTIVSAGSTTITASQDICGNYSASSKTGVFTVSGVTPTYTPASPSASVTKTYGVDVSFSLTDLVAGISNSNGAYTFTSGSGAVSISGAVATIVAYTPSAITITATQDASGNYASGSTAITVLVNRGTPTYQSVSPVAKTYGTDVSFSLATVMSGISNSSGAYAFSVNPTITTQILSTNNMNNVTGADFNGGQYQSNLVVAHAGNLAGWDEAGNGTVCIVDISNVYGSATNTPNYAIMFWVDNVITQTTAVSNSNVTGSQYTVNYKAGPAVYQIPHEATQATASDGIVFEILRANNTVLATSTYLPGAWAGYPTLTPSSFTYTGDGSGDVRVRIKTVSSSTGRFGGCVDDVVISGQASTSSVLTISGNTATIIGAGTTTVLASQDASGNYAASSTTISLAVATATPTFQSVAQISKTFSTDVSFSMTPIVAGMSNSDGAFIFTTSGSAVGVVDICGAVVTILAYTPSAVNIDVYQEASGNYTYKTGTISLLVARKVPSYGAFTIPAVTYSPDGSFSIASYAPTTDSTGVALTYTSSAPSVATISSDGTVVTIVGHGSTTITASQVATGNYAASSTTGVLTVNRAAPTFLKAFTIDNKVFGDAPFSLLPFTVGLDNTDGTYHFSSSNPSIVSISTVDNVTATILAYTPSPITITVDIDACGNYAASTTSGTLTVARAAPTYQSVSQVSKTFGVDASFSLTAVMTGISNSSGAYTFSGGAGVISISGAVATIVAYTPEAVTITATQNASGNYAASSKTFTLLVARGTPTYQTVSQVAKTYGTDASFSLTAVMSGISNSDGAYTFTSSSGAVSISGGVATILAYTPSAVTLTATQDASGNYVSSSKTFTVLVSPGTPTYQSVSQVSKTFGVDASFSLTAVMSGISNSDGAYTFSGGAGVISISGGVATILAYTPSAVTLTATQDASGNYVASSKTFTLLVSPGTPTLSNFNNVNKLYGASPFSITPPTSNSSGAFTYTSSNTSVATISSIIYNSLDFDGGNDNVTVANIGSFSSLTLEVWVYNNLDTNGTNYAQLVSRGANGNGWDWSLYLIPPDAGFPMNTLRWVGPGGTTINTNVIELNTWTHVAVTCNNVETKIYINGTLITTQSTTNTMTNYTSGIMFGNDISQTRPYKGRLSDVRIWNVIRTASEIANNYQLSLAGNESGLVGNWKLNQGTAGSNNSGVTTAIDSSSSGKNGTLNNFSLSGSTSNWMAGPMMVSSITIVSPGTSTITATQDANGNYQTGTISSTLTVINSTPTYQSVAQISKTYGTDVSFSLASFVAGISDSSGAYTFSSSSAAISISGDVVTILGYTPSAASITASQAAAGSYDAASTTLSLLVSRAAPTYQSVAQITKTFGVDVSFSLASVVAGISNSDGAYSTFSSASGAVQISGDVVTILAYTPDAVTITASQDASGNYASSSKTLSLLVSRGTPTYQSVAQISKTYGTDASFSMTAVMSGISNSSGGYTFSTSASADLINISGDVVTINAYTPSAVTITASQEASGNYTSSSTTVTLLVDRKVPSYGAFTLPAVTYEDAPYSLVSSAPTSESNAAYSYTSSNAAVATVNSAGTVVTVIGQGYTTITAAQDASGNYAAGSTTASLLVNRAAPTFLKAFTIDNKTFGDASFSLLPFTVGLDNTDGTYHFSSSDASVVSISEADGVTATILAYSATPVTIYVAIDACGNYAASTTSGTLTIGRAVPAYQAVSTVTKTFGDAAFSLVSYMSGISESSGSYTFASSDASAVSIGGDGVTATILAYTASAITITATQAASGNYATGTKTFSLTVARVAPTIGALSLGPLNGYYDVSNGYFTLTAPTSNSSGAFTYASDNTSVATVSDPSFTTANLMVRYDPSDPANYTVSNGIIENMTDLTGSGRHLGRNGTGTNVVAVGSKNMLNCSAMYTGFYVNLPLTYNNTFFMVIRYNPDNVIQDYGTFAQHGNRDSDWSILKKPGSDNTLLYKSGYDDTNVGLDLTPNTSYILISRGGTIGRVREFWAYSENGTSSHAYYNANNTLMNGTKYMYIGVSNGNHSCRSYIGEMMYYNATISDSDISNNLMYLQKKWFNAAGSTKVVRLLTSGTANISATQDICGNYSTGSVSSLLRVGATVPTFGTFTVSSTTKTYGDGAFTITPPTSNSNGAFTITSGDSSIVSISGTTATIVAGGTVDITVTQDPSGSFTRKSVTSSFTVEPKNPNLRNFPAIVKSFADGSFTVTPPDTDGPGYFTYTASPVGVLTGGGMVNPVFGIVNGGSTVITAAQVGSQNYAASSITATVTVTPILPSASYSNFTRAFDVGSFTIPAPTTANSGSSVSYTSSDLSVATISGSTVTVQKVGETTITATIAANSAYLVRDISAVLTVTIGTPSMNGLSNQTLVMTQAPYTLSPTSSSNGTFSYVSDNSAVVFMTDSGTTFNVASVGTANITATISQDTSANYNTRTSTFVITVNRATSNLSSRTFAVPALMTYGDTPVNITTVPVSDSSGAITYTSANTNLATIHPTTGLITALGAGWNYFIASQAQTDVHNASTVQSNYMQFVSKAVTLSRAAPYTSSTITKYYGDAPFELSSTSESNAGKSYSPSNSVVSVTVPSTSAYITINNVGTVVITGSQFGNSQYSIQNQVTWTLTVEKGTTALTGLAATLSKNVTDAPFTLAVSSASGGTKTYALSNPDDSSILTVNSSTGVVTLLGAGTATVVVSQAASSLYNAPASVSCVITVAAAGTALQGSTITSSRTFDNVDMSGASLSGTTVTGVSFAGAVLTNAVLTGATLTNSTMTSTDLSGASMANTIISGTSFAGATMTRVVLTGATFNNSTLTSVGLVGASMANTDISGSSFAGSTMTSAILTGATLTGSTLSSTDLSGASMANTTITGTTFASATMTNAVLTGTTMTNSTLTGTVLTGASLVSANVTGSTFVGASLASADLSGATVTNANFTNANISGANITNVAFSSLQKIQLLKNTNNRAIGGIQVSDVSGSTILSAISSTSPAASIPNIATAIIKVVIPTTSTSSSATLPDVVLDTSGSDKFYFPINEDEYFQILGVKYYTSNGIVKNAATNATVEVIPYGNKSIWLIAGSIVANVLTVNTLSNSSFIVPPGKMVTDAPFNITVAPSSNSDAPIVYSSNNTSVATIHPSTGLITIVGQGYVNFIATQAATLLYEPSTKTSNALNVNILVDFTLNGLNQTITMTTSGLLDGAAIELETTDATAVFYVKVSDMTDLFKFQTDSQSSNNDAASDVKYFVFNRKWPAALKINPAHAMMNKTESTGILGSAGMFSDNKILAKHDFLRYLSQQLFNTIHGVDLFGNESDLLENATYWGENVRVNINNILTSISTTSSDVSMNYDVSGNRYLTDSVTADTNICRELMRQMIAGASSRFSSITNGTVPQSLPFVENDSINFKVTFQSTATQNMLTGVESIPTRSYMVKLVMKNSVSGGNLNTVVADSEMYPNAYPYSSGVTSYAPSAASSAVYNSYSPPAPIPFARFGFDGWYYTNSTAWVTSAYRNHIKWALPANSGSATVGSLQYIRVNLKIHNKVALPYIMVYTQSTSSRKYTVTNTGALVNGTMYSFYVNLNSYTREPAMIGYTNAAMSNNTTTGSFANNELILNVALETDIGAAAGTVDFTLSSIVIGDIVAGEKEYGFEADVPVAYP